MKSYWSSDRDSTPPRHVSQEPDRLQHGEQTRILPGAMTEQSEQHETNSADGPCPFCYEASSGEHVVAEFGTVVAIADTVPVAQGHLLIITRRHADDLFAMTAAEQADAMTLAGMLRDGALKDDPAITGFNVGANCGVSAGQRVMHAHIHFIPRRGEAPVKGVIRNKMTY